MKPLKPENAELLKRLHLEPLSGRAARHAFTPENLDRLLEAAREEGRLIGHREAGPRGREFPNGYE